MTDTEIDTPDGTLSQQFGLNNIRIENLLPLHIGLKNSTEKKIVEILEILRTQLNISDNHRDILIHLIDSCKCKQYTSRRISSRYERLVIKTSHT